MTHHAVDLTAHINRDVGDENAARFPVTLKPILFRKNGSLVDVPARFAVVREDTDEPLAIVSDRYRLVPHGRVLDTVTRATERLAAGPVPRGIYIDRRGARMRALYKFPALARPVFGDDLTCPCVKIENSYDAMSRMTVHIGAFRFVCTNLAVGGGGAFAGGFMAVHQGEIPIERIADQLDSYLSRFGAIIETYRRWAGEPADRDRVESILDPLPKRTAKAVRDGIARAQHPTVYAAYNAATHVATHRMRSYRSAFDLLEKINRGFQEAFPPSRN